MNRPTDLKCEYLQDPLGIDVKIPRFSWIPPRGPRGSAQKAYRIICSREKSALRNEVGDLWDSGKVDSDRCYLIEFGSTGGKGPTLREDEDYWWAVKTWSEAESAWSEPGRFSTGILDESSWKASWISMPTPEFETSRVLLVEGSINKNTHVPAKLYRGMYFRRKARIEKRPTRAMAYFCGLGYGELYVNSVKAGNHRLDPGQTDYAKGALYSTFDITDLLREGDNAFGIVLGNGRYIDAYGFGKPRAFLQVSIEFAGGSKTYFLTDSSWTCSHGPLLDNGIYSGEIFDARLEEKEWASPDFNDEAWGRVEIVSGHSLSSQMMPPIRAVKELPARSMSSPEPGVFLFDFGQNFAGVVRLYASGKSGTRISMRFSELLSEDGNLHLGTNRESQSQDTFVLAGTGEEVFEPRFTYHGFRYVEVRGFPGTPNIDAVRGIVLHTDVEQAGAFACADALVNSIHSNVLWGQLSNLMSAPTDCPQRGERMGWLGDAQLASEEACCNFDMASFYRKYLEDIARAQRPDGCLSDVVPPFWPLYPADPAWSTAYIVLAWTMYWNYGDERILSRHFSGLKKYVDFLAASSEGHILKSLGSYGDWCPPGTIYPKKTPMEFTSTWYFYHDTVFLSRIAGVLGMKEEEKHYEGMAGEIAAAFNRRFLLGDGKYATLRMSPIDKSVGQTTQALPLFLDIVPENQRAQAVENLLEAVVMAADSHIDAGIVGTRYLFEVLRDAGHSDVAWNAITQKTYPGWGYMVEEGATTLWERWEKLSGMGMNSHNHIMFGSVDAWFYRSIGGIIPLEPAWKKVLVAPKTPGKLSHASASQKTPRGTLYVSWSRSPWLRGDGGAHHESDRNGGEFKLSVSVPDGLNVHIEMPYADLGRELFEGGAEILKMEEGRSPSFRNGGGAQPDAAFDGCGGLKVSGDVVGIDVGAGDYEFTMSW